MSRFLWILNRFNCLTVFLDSIFLSHFNGFLENIFVDFYVFSIDFLIYIKMKIIRKIGLWRLLSY